MFYSKRPPESYNMVGVHIPETDNLAQWNLLWLFYPHMDKLEEIHATLDDAKSIEPYGEWFKDFDVKYSSAIEVDLTRPDIRLREQVESLPPVAFMDWLWKQAFANLFIYEVVGLNGMRLAATRAKWLDPSVENPPSAEIIKVDFKKRA